MKTAIVILAIIVIGLGLITVMQWNTIKKLSVAPDGSTQNTSSGTGDSKTVSLGDIASTIQKNGGSLELNAKF